MPVSDGVWAGWVNKEFTTTMQSKGKMEVNKGVGQLALDKRNEAFDGVKRIFVADQLPFDKVKLPKSANPEKVLLKSKLKALSNQLKEETKKREELEAQLAAMQASKGAGE